MKFKLIICFLLISASCIDKKSADPEAMKAELIEADKAFSAMSEKQGIREAFLVFAAPEIIKPQNDKQPLVGLEALKKSFDASALGDDILTWEPLKADVSGDIGYTFGHWTSKSKDLDATTRYGNYVSIWKRQPDGSWKVVLDTGNPTDGPTSLP